MTYSLREMSLDETLLMIRYFREGSPEFLRGMGADPSKLPLEADWFDALQRDFSNSLDQREFFYLVWLAHDEPIGHCNLNKIVFGMEAFLHLHIWVAKHRRQGCASRLLPKSITTFFDRFELKHLYCEPYAKNAGPNTVLPKLGFHFERSYVTTPSAITFSQTVNRWRIDRETAERQFAPVDQSVR